MRTLTFQNLSGKIQVESNKTSSLVCILFSRNNIFYLTTLDCYDLDITAKHLTFMLTMKSFPDHLAPATQRDVAVRQRTMVHLKERERGGEKNLRSTTVLI